MNVTLVRTEFKQTGIFGVLMDPDGKHICVTLEHAYGGEGSYEPKVPCGTYRCVKGMHRLSHMITDFTTYEVLGVPGCTGILFHSGNENSDSEGCILLGEAVKKDRLLKSLKTFLDFKALQGVENKEFVLKIVNGLDPLDTINSTPPQDLPQPA